MKLMIQEMKNMGLDVENNPIPFKEGQEKGPGNLGEEIYYDEETILTNDTSMNRSSKRLADFHSSHGNNAN